MNKEDFVAKLLNEEICIYYDDDNSVTIEEMRYCLNKLNITLSSEDLCDEIPIIRFDGQWYCHFHKIDSGVVFFNNYTSKNKNIWTSEKFIKECYKYEKNKIKQKAVRTNALDGSNYELRLSLQKGWIVKNIIPLGDSVVEYILEKDFK